MPLIYTTNLIKFPKFFQMAIPHSISELCAVLYLVAQLCLIFVTPWARQDPVHGIFQARILEWCNTLRLMSRAIL